MSFRDIFLVVKQVFQNKDVILIFVIVLLYLNFVFYITRYKKNTVHSRIKKVKKINTGAEKANTDNENSENKTPSANDADNAANKTKSASSSKKK